MIWTAPEIWKGGECWIIGGGPSLPYQFDVPKDVTEDVMSGKRGPDAYSEYLQPIHDKHVIGVNNAYKIGDWIDVCFFGDCSWYLVHRFGIAAFPGMKITSCDRFAKKPQEKMEGIKYLPRWKQHRFGISTNPKAVSWNGNSGAAAISVAALFGVKRIILLGFDMTMNGSGWSHWHGSHGRKGEKPKKNPPFARHSKAFPEIARDAKTLSIEIVNASPDSKIEVFPKVAVRELLNGS